MAREVPTVVRPKNPWQNKLGNALQGVGQSALQGAELGLKYQQLKDQEMMRESRKQTAKDFSNSLNLLWKDNELAKPQSEPAETFESDGMLRDMFPKPSLTSSALDMTPDVLPDATKTNFSALSQPLNFDQEYEKVKMALPPQDQDELDQIIQFGKERLSMLYKRAGETGSNEDMQMAENAANHYFSLLGQRYRIDTERMKHAAKLEADEYFKTVTQPQLKERQTRVEEEEKRKTEGVKIKGRKELAETKAANLRDYSVDALTKMQKTAEHRLTSARSMFQQFSTDERDAEVQAAQEDYDSITNALRSKLIQKPASQGVNEERRRTKEGRIAVFDADTKTFIRYE